MGHWYNGGFSEFSKTTQGWALPFDNIFSTSDGFVARQVNQANPLLRVFTWRFSRRCHSFVTIPLPTLEEGHWANYQTAQEFVAELSSHQIPPPHILDLNAAIDIVGATMRRHRILAGKAGITGPFYLKSHLNNVWGCVPYVDNSAYIDHIREFSFPIVQDASIVVPDGTSLETFIVSPDTGRTPSEDELVYYDGPIELSLSILNALGMPMEVLARSIDDLHRMGKRRMAAQEMKRNSHR